MSEYGYPKQARLRKRYEYRSLSRAGTKCLRKHFLCLYRKGSGQRSRLGITVSRKVGTAVTRNRIKRLCREFFRLNQHRLAGVWDISIIARHSAAGASRDQALASLASIFEDIAGKRPSDD